MKKLQSSLKNMLLVLTGVTVVSVALLAWVNELTKGPIAEANAKALNQALKEVLPEFTNNPVEESDTIFDERSEEHTSELQSRQYLVCRLLLEKKKIIDPLL